MRIKIALILESRIQILIIMMSDNCGNREEEGNVMVWKTECICKRRLEAGIITFVTRNLVAFLITMRKLEVVRVFVS